MNDITTSIIASAAWDAIKGGMKISTDFLKSKLSKWLLSDVEISQIQSAIINTPEPCLQSKDILKAYLDLNKDVLDIVEKHSQPIGNHQDNSNSSGINIGGSNSGQITQYINNYSNGNLEEPKIPQGDFDIIKDYNRWHNAQLLTSWEMTRSNLQVLQIGGDYALKTNINIPAEILSQPNQHFAMILFSYVPGENWEKYCNSGYNLEFKINTSENIKQIQLEIKNSSQAKFVDIPIKSSKVFFKDKMMNLTKISAWRDIGEICLTLFINPNYIEGGSGYIEISGLKLTQGNTTNRRGDT